MTSKTNAERFFEKVNVNGSIPAHRPELGNCWEWKASLVWGYGSFSVGYTTFRAHRWLYQQMNDHAPKLPEYVLVLHKCDNKKCVNPDHLFLGSQADNVSDMISKGRFNVARGKDSGPARHPEAHRGRRKQFRGIPR